MRLNVNLLAVLATASVATGLALAGANTNEGPAPQPEVETPGIKQKVLTDAPLAQFPGKRVLVFAAEFEPGAKTPLHRHPGTELLYVLEGEGRMVLPEREKSEQLTPGRMILVQPLAGENSFIHQAVNLSTSEGMKTLVIVIHDEGTPPAMPVDDDA